MSRNTAADYRHRPPHLWLANFAGRNLGLNRGVSLDPDGLIERAASRAGHDDFGPDTWRPCFERLCRALEDEARLSLIGRLSARNHLLQLLANRLDIEAARKADAAIAGQSVDRPVFITGLPRTGSTLLHGLLSRDPALAVPWTWEVMLAGMPPGASPAADARRVDKTDALLSWVERLAPGFKTIHPVGARLPQECIAITAHEFASVEFHTTFNVPSYQRRLDNEGQQPALDYHRRFVQHLQLHRAAHQWVFKAPAHLYSLPEIVAAYPDARFVFTLRDPAQVVASIASHGVVLRSAFSDKVNVPAVAREWMHWWAEGLRRARAFRDANRNVQFLDLDYDELVADPVAVAAGLYEKLDWSWSDQAGRRMRAFLTDNAQDKHGRHRYTLEQFGLDPGEVAALFAR